MITLLEFQRNKLKVDQMAQTFVCDLCKKKLYSKKALEEHYKTHSPQNKKEQSNGSEQGYVETAVDREAKLAYAAMGPSFRLL
jgi:C2H2-type zinc finger protein